MIKVLKLQKAIFLIVLGIVGLIAFKIMEADKIESAIYVLKFSGILLLAGSAWLVYPILFAKKVNEEEVQLDPDKHEEIIDPLTIDRP